MADDARQLPDRQSDASDPRTGRKLLAKGADLVAQRIREKGKEHGVPIVENPPLARRIYGDVEVGDSIPLDLFQAVAEVLAYVYKLKNRSL